MNNEQREKIGISIKLARKKQGFSQAKLATVCSVSQTIISKLETGKPVSIKYVHAVSKTLDIDSDAYPKIKTGFFWSLCRNQNCEHYPVSFQRDFKHFENTNFCYACGKSLIKECLKCKTKITGDHGSEYCFCEKCGSPFF